MKNLFFKSRVLSFLFVIIVSLLALSLSAQNSGLQNCTITATGTGKTTGDIVALTIYNPSDKEVKGSLGPYFIPSGGSYQPYITMEKVPVTVPPDKTVYITLKGFCADISKPAATEKDNFKPINTWIKIDDIHTGVLPPSQLKINPGTDPEMAAPYYLGALEAIMKAYDEMKGKGTITTPFSANPEKEREAVIQQTFWIYTAEVLQKPYTKEQFTERTYVQFEHSSNIKPFTLPPDKKQQLDKGIDDFWNTFQAVGAEAKVLSSVPSSKPETNNGIGTPTGPETKPVCACGECRLAEGQRIDISLTKSIDLFEGDSIPWTNNHVYIERPVVYSTCIPAECLPKRTYEIRTTITYKDKHLPPVTPTGWVEYDYQMSSPIMEHPGEMLIEFRFRCYCDGKFCKEGIASRKIYFIERNNCCDSIRAQNNGLLQFNFKGGNVVISGNTLTISVPPNKPEPFVFDFNLEAVFCNLTDDQIFSKFVQIMQQQSSGDKTTEFYNASDVTMSKPTDDATNTSYYGFGFTKQINDKSVGVWFTIDKRTCIYDIQVLFKDEVYEFAGPPYWSPTQMFTMTSNMGQTSSPVFWMNTVRMLSHLLRVHDYNKDGLYLNAYTNYLAMLGTGVSDLIKNTNDPALKAQAQALLDAIRQALNDRANPSHLGDLMEKLIPVANAMNK